MIHRFIISAILIGSLGIASNSIAAPGNCDCPPSPPHKKGMHQGHAGHAPGFPPHLVAQLELNEDQMTAVDQIMTEQRSKTRELRNRLAKKHPEMKKLAEAETFDENLIRAQAMEIAHIEADLMVLRLTTDHKIALLLTAEQKEMLQCMQAGQPNHHRGHRPPHRPPVPPMEREACPNNRPF